MRNHQKGFTLIELLVVIAIIGLLSTLAVVSFSGAQTRARDARRVSDIRQLQTAMESYNAQYGTYDISAGSEGGNLCDNGDPVSTCDNADLDEIIPQLDDIVDPQDTTVCTDSLTDCNYGFGYNFEDTYDVYFSTEGDDVEGLDNFRYHTLNELGLDA